MRSLSAALSLFSLFWHTVGAEQTLAKDLGSSANLKDTSPMTPIRSSAYRASSSQDVEVDLKHIQEEIAISSAICADAQLMLVKADHWCTVTGIYCTVDREGQPEERPRQRVHCVRDDRPVLSYCVEQSRWRFTDSQSKGKRCLAFSKDGGLSPVGEATTWYGFQKRTSRYCKVCVAIFPIDSGKLGWEKAVQDELCMHFKIAHAAEVNEGRTDSGVASHIEVT